MILIENQCFFLQFRLEAIAHKVWMIAKKSERRCKVVVICNILQNECFLSLEDVRIVTFRLHNKNQNYYFRKRTTLPSIYPAWIYKFRPNTPHCPCCQYIFFRFFNVNLSVSPSAVDHTQTQWSTYINSDATADNSRKNNDTSRCANIKTPSGGYVVYLVPTQ